MSRFKIISNFAFMSEIDNIFAKAKSAPIDLPVASSSSPSLERKVKKRKRRSHITDSDTGTHQDKASSSKVKKHPIPKTIVDPSIPISTTKRRKGNLPSIVESDSTASKFRNRHDEEKNFKDSRGLEPREPFYFV